MDAPSRPYFYVNEEICRLADKIRSQLRWATAHRRCLGFFCVVHVLYWFSFPSINSSFVYMYHFYSWYIAISSVSRTYILHHFTLKSDHPPWYYCSESLGRQEIALFFALSHNYAIAWQKLYLSLSNNWPLTWVPPETLFLRSTANYAIRPVRWIRAQFAHGDICNNVSSVRRAICFIVPSDNFHVFLAILSADQSNTTLGANTNDLARSQSSLNHAYSMTHLPLRTLSAKITFNGDVEWHTRISYIRLYPYALPPQNKSQRRVARLFPSRCCSISMRSLWL